MLAEGFPEAFPAAFEGPSGSHPERFLEGIAKAMPQIPTFGAALRSTCVCAAHVFLHISALSLVIRKTLQHLEADVLHHCRRASCAKHARKDGSTTSVLLGY